MSSRRYAQTAAERERDTVTCEPHYGFRERLGVRPDRAPGKLGVAVGGQVRSDLLDDFWQALQRHEQPGGEGYGQVDQLDDRHCGAGPGKVTDGESEEDERYRAQEQSVCQGRPDPRSRL